MSHPQKKTGCKSSATGGAIGSFIGPKVHRPRPISRYRLHDATGSSFYDDIVNEPANINDEKSSHVFLMTPKMSEPIKTNPDEFDEVLKLLDFGNVGYDIFTNGMLMED